MRRDQMSKFFILLFFLFYEGGGFATKQGFAEGRGFAEGQGIVAGRGLAKGGLHSTAKVTVTNLPPEDVAPLQAEAFPLGEKPKLLHFKPWDMEGGQMLWLNQAPVIKASAEGIVQGKRREILKSAESFFQEFPHSAFLPYRLYVTEMRRFPFRDPDIVSARMTLYTYTGGAHGGSHYYNWNWSKRRKRFLSLSEALPSGKFEIVADRVRKALFESQKLGDGYDKYRKAHIQRGASTTEDFKIWNFHENGIRFVFPEYQVASYAAGRFEVFVPNLP